MEHPAVSSGIDVQRVMERLDALYACGRLPDGTHSRLACSPEDVCGRDMYMGWFRDIGVEPRVDEAGNIIARLEGSRGGLPAIITGSHLDTVPDGGKYDGAVGCVAALEVFEALIKENRRLEHPLEAVVFTDEEGARFGGGLIGSSSFCSLDLDISDCDRDIYGCVRGDVYDAFGVDSARFAAAARARDSVHCFVELHVEQGANLERCGMPIGIVTSIAGVRRWEITVEGEANHSGSTMMADRKDALIAASRFIAEAPDTVAEHGGEFTVATVGMLKVLPNAVNVIPGTVLFSLEIRDQDTETLDRVERALREKLGGFCRGYGVSCDLISRHEPAPMSEWVREAIAGACEDLGYEYASLPSGAFHDAMPISRVFPAGMIFIPSVGGISHSPRELSRPEDIARGCNLLKSAVLALDAR